MRLGSTFYLDELVVPERASFSAEIGARLGASVEPMPDGEIHRFDIDKAGDKAGWYVYYDNNGFLLGIAGSWKNGEHFRWTSKETLSEEELRYVENVTEETKRRRDELKATISECVTDLFPTLKIAESHPYFDKKNVSNIGDIARLTEDGCLALPVYTKKGLTSIQFINGNGDKRFFSGGEVSGGYLVIPGTVGRTYLVEGFATGLSVRAATGAEVIVAFNAGNLPKVADSFGDRNLIVVADNDESGTGEKYAKATGKPYILIPIVGMDANDYANAGHDLKALLEAKAEWFEHADSYLTQPETVQWLVKHWLPRGGVTMIFGASNSGKTFAALDMLLSISTGQEDWLGEKVKQGNVIYLCGEGRIGLRSRVAGWLQNRGLEKTGNFLVSKTSKYLNDSAEFSEVISLIDSCGFVPTVIAIDTLNRFFSGDENSAQEAGIFLKACEVLQLRYGCSILIIHHSGASEEAKKRARGSTAFRGAVDTEICVVRSDQGIVTLMQTKQKDAEISPDKEFILKGIEVKGWFDEDGEPVTTAVVSELTPEEKETRKEPVEEMMIFMDAWAHGDCRISGEMPMVTKAEIKEELERKGWTKNQIKNAFRSESRRLIPRLKEFNIIADRVDGLVEGWVVVREDMASAMILMKKGEI